MKHAYSIFQSKSPEHTSHHNYDFPSPLEMFQEDLKAELQYTHIKYNEFTHTQTTLVQKKTHTHKQRPCAQRGNFSKFSPALLQHLIAVLNCNICLSFPWRTTLVGCICLFVCTNHFTVLIRFYGETTKTRCSRRKDEASVFFVYVKKQAMICMNNFNYNLNFQYWAFQPYS